MKNKEVELHDSRCSEPTNGIHLKITWKVVIGCIWKTSLTVMQAKDLKVKMYVVQLQINSIKIQSRFLTLTNFNGLS